MLHYTRVYAVEQDHQCQAHLLSEQLEFRTWRNVLCTHTTLAAGRCSWYYRAQDADEMTVMLNLLRQLFQAISSTTFDRKKS